MKMQKKQAGFTLIELIVVIVVLGILGAVALPRFVNFGTDARISVLDGVEGAAASAAAMAYGRAALDATVDLTEATAGPITIAGQATDLVFGYPDAADINALLSDNGGTTFDTATGTWEVRDDCTLTYVNAASANAVPTFTRVITGC